MPSSTELLIFCALAAAYIVLAVYQVYLNQWLQIRWRQWMTRAYLGKWLDARQPLPHAASRRRRRQPRPAHRRGHQHVHREERCTSASACSTRSSRSDRSSSSSGRCRRRAPLHPVRHQLEHPGLSGLGGADLLHRRHRDHPLIGRAADRAQLHAAALRSGLPLQPGAGARELRADRAAQRRGRGDASGCSSGSAASSATGS